MILRRVIAHVTAQNWFAVAIDIVIVVAGVFIGIQVSNWNAGEADKRLGAEYVTRLTRDLRTDLVSVQTGVDYFNAVLDSVLKTDALLREADPDPLALVFNAYRATEIMYSAPVRATWDEIVNAGHLDLLPAGAVASGLSQYYAFDVAQDVYRLGAASGYREAVRKIIPIGVQTALRESCSDERDQGQNITGFSVGCRLQSDPETLAAIAAALRSDPAVAAELRYQYTFAVSAALNLGGLKSSVEQALAALGAGPGGAAKERA